MNVIFCDSVATYNCKISLILRHGYNKFFFLNYFIFSILSCIYGLSSLLHRVGLYDASKQGHETVPLVIYTQARKSCNGVPLT